MCGSQYQHEQNARNHFEYTAVLYRKKEEKLLFLFLFILAGKNEWEFSIRPILKMTQRMDLPGWLQFYILI